MASFDDLIHRTPASPTSAVELLSKLWSCDSSSRLENQQLDLDAYFAYYKTQGSHALHDGGRHISVRTHREILEIAKNLEEGVSREGMRERLSLQLTDPKPANENEVLDSSIDLTARLISMMSIGVLQYGFSGRRGLVWDHGSLKEFVDSYFNVPVVLGQEVKLEKIFNARNLDRIAGINIVWTDNIADHLRMMDEDKNVAIFHHASFLKGQNSTLFPSGLMEETLRTLALLFPQSDEETATWFGKLPYSLHIDNQVVRCGHLRADDRQIEKFKFWHDRLVILKQVFDDSRPSTLSQWWCDRRNSVQWYTFWVAIMVLFLTVFFGLVQNIEGALQVYKAYYPTPP